MKKTTYFKSLLLAAGLCVGASAWAGKVGVVTTNAKMTFAGTLSAGSSWSYTKDASELGSISGQGWTNASSVIGVSVSNGHLNLSNGNGSLTWTSTAGTKDVVTLSFDAAYGGAWAETGTAEQQFVIYSGSTAVVTEKYNVNNNTITSSTMGVTTSDVKIPTNSANWSNKVHFLFTFNYATKKIHLTTTCSAATNTTNNFEIDMPDNSGIDKIYFSSSKMYTDRGFFIDNIYVTTTEGDYGDIVSDVNSYTVNNTDVYQLFTEIQCPDITLELFGSGTRSTTDYYFKYTDGSGWASYTKEESDVVTYECAVTKYNTTEPTAADISGADDPTDGQIAKVTVTVSDKWQTETNNSKLCLTGPMGTTTSGYQPIAGVIYKFTPTKDGYLNFNFYKYNNIQYRAWVSGNSYYENFRSSNNELTTWTIWLTKGKSYYLFSGNTTTYQMKMYSFDFVPSVSGTITDCGWSTFASPYALDLSTISGGTAYYASDASVGTVTLTSTTATVPAGEGIMVKGTAGETFSIGVAASGTAISGNLLKGQTATGTVTASGTDSKYHYVFGYSKTNSSEYGFYNLASDTEVAAGKAYLETTTALSAAARLAIVFDDEATDIQTVQGSVLKVQGEYYNLSGQRVTAPQKGLYIVNGKKVVVK